MEDIKASTQAAVNTLLNPSRVWSLDDVRGRPCPVPAVAGIYAWYFREIPGRIAVDGCAKHDGLTLMYSGISPGFPGSRGNLRKRIRTHYRPRGRSTLRRALGCLLEEQLSLRLVPQPGGTSFYYGETEEILSEWMAQNAFVVWAEHDEPWETEKAIIKQVNLPLNISHNHRHEFRAILQALRADARARVEVMRAAMDAEP